MTATLKKWCLAALRPILTVLVAMVIGSLLVLPTGTSPLEAYRALFIGAFGSPTALLNTLTRATPLLFCGLSACIALKSGVFNIGLEGQLYLGGITSALVAVYLDFLPGFPPDPGRFPRRRSGRHPLVPHPRLSEGKTGGQFGHHFHYDEQYRHLVHHLSGYLCFQG